MLHTLTDTQTDWLNNSTLYAPWHEKAFLPTGKNGLITSREVNEGRGGLILAVGRVRSEGKKKRKKTKTNKIAPPETHH